MTEQDRKDPVHGSCLCGSVAFEATTLESACSAVAARLGVAFVAQALTQVLALPGVVYRPFAPPAPPPPPVHITTPIPPLPKQTAPAPAQFLPAHLRWP